MKVLLELRWDFSDLVWISNDPNSTTSQLVRICLGDIPKPQRISVNLSITIQCETFSPHLSVITLNSYPLARQTPIPNVNTTPSTDVVNLSTVTSTQKADQSPRRANN